MIEETEKQWHKYLALGFGIICISTASILIRFAQDEVASIVISAYRLTLATLIIGVIAIFKKESIRPIFEKRNAWLILLSGTFLAVHFISWIKSLEMTSVASSVVLVTTTPLWVALLSPLILKEKITRNILVGLLIAFFGLICVSLSERCGFTDGRLACQSGSQQITLDVFRGNSLALLGALMAAGYMIIGRIMRKRVSALQYTFGVYGVAAIVVDLIAIFSEAELGGFSIRSYAWLVALAIIPQLFGHSIFNWALKYLQASVVSIAILGEPIGTIILALIFLKEAPTIIELVGACLILAGILLASITRVPVNEV